MTMTDQEQRALAYLAVRSRPHGARRWDEAGTLANIAKIAHIDLAEAILRTIRAARDPNVISPGVIPTAGPHCNERLIEATTVIASKGPWCASCGQGELALVHRDGTCSWTEKPPKADPARKAELLEAARADMAAHPGPAVVEATPVGETCTTGGCIRGAGHTGSHLAAPATEPERETA